MSDSVFDNFNGLYRLVRLYRDRWECREDLRCGICGHMLVDARQLLCGCAHCAECIEWYRASGGRVCPGPSIECGHACVMSTHVDNRVNKLVFGTTVECPNEACSLTCELRHMERHLGECGGRGEQREGRGEKDLWPMEPGTEEHDALNWKNEVLEMRLTQEGMRSTVAGLEDTVAASADAVASIRADTDWIKADRDRFEERMERMENALTNTVDELAARNKDAIERMSEMVQVIEGKLDVSIKKFDETERRLSELESRLDALLYTSSSSSCDEFLWNIGDINNIEIDKSVQKCSEFFYLLNNFYKTKLNLWNYYDKLGVQLSLSPEPNDALLRWPVKVNVTVRILDGDDPDRFKENMKDCTIYQPGDVRNSTGGDWILFDKSDLSSAGLLDKSNCVVKCCVNFKH